MTEAAVEAVVQRDLPAASDLDAHLEAYRVELTGYCYRILGSALGAIPALVYAFPILG